MNTQDQIRVDKFLQLMYHKVYGHCQATDNIQECVLEKEHQGEHEFRWTTYEDDLLSSLKMIESLKKL